MATTHLGLPSILPAAQPSLKAEDKILASPPRPHFLQDHPSLLSRLELAFFISVTAISQLFTATRIKGGDTEIVALQLSGWGGCGGMTEASSFLPLPFQKREVVKNMAHLWHRPPQQLSRSQPPWVPPQYGVCSQTPRRGVGCCRARLSKEHHPVQFPSRPEPPSCLVTYKSVQGTEQNQTLAFSLRLKCFITEKKKIC